MAATAPAMRAKAAGTAVGMYPSPGDAVEAGVASAVVDVPAVVEPPAAVDVAVDAAPVLVIPLAT
jgi:hypothetical protein